jgi:hypothetical protein
MALRLQLSHIKHRRYVRTNEFRTNCIYCDDVKEHLYVNTDMKVFHCFKCGASGTVVVDSPAREPVTTHNDWVPPFGDPTPEAVEYLRKRGLEVAEILLFNPKSSPLYPQYVFSFYSQVAIVGRAIVPDLEPKYRIFKSQGTRLWGIEYIDLKLPLIVVEGCFDLFGVRRSYPNVVATLGKTYSQLVANYLKSYPKDVYICLDADAQAEQLYIRQQLQVWKQNVYLLLLSKGDPWDARDVDFSTLLNKEDRYVTCAS